MGKPRYPWWSYVKSMIRRYPELQKEYALMREPSLVPPPDRIGHSSGISRPTERAALLELPYTKQREYEAVKLAIRQTEQLRDGADRLRLIDLVYWKGTHNLQGAVMQIPCCWAVGAKWHGDFIRLVALYYGLMDE